jgi:hypothetical protein
MGTGGCSRMARYFHFMSAVDYSWTTIPGTRSHMVLRENSSVGRSAVIRLIGLLVSMIVVCSNTNAEPQSGAPAQGRALVDAIGIEHIMTSPMHQQMLTFMRPLQEANGARQQEVFEIFNTIIMPQAMLVFAAEPVKNEIGKYYDQNFSASELQELISFFSTPVGKKFASKNSALADGLQTLAVRLFGTVTVQGALRRGVGEIEKRGMIIPKPPAR